MSGTHRHEGEIVNRDTPVDSEAMAAELRGQGMTWLEIAEHLRHRFGLNALTAMRAAHGWTQRRAAEEWNRRWPEDEKTDKQFSYWEAWPTPSGHPPSQLSLARLAEMYECAAADLIGGVADFRSSDAHAVLIGHGRTSNAPIVGDAACS